MFEFIDRNDDKRIQWDEVLNTNKLDISGIRYSPEPQISSIIGVALFENLDTLLCAWNELSDINLSENKKIKYLDCHSNFTIQSIVLPPSSSLQTLLCNNNSLTNLDLEGQGNLDILVCFANSGLTRLNIIKTSLNKVNLGEIQKLEICIESIENWDDIPSKLNVQDHTLNFNCGELTNTLSEFAIEEDEVIRVTNIQGQEIHTLRKDESVIYHYRSGRKMKVMFK